MNVRLNKSSTFAALRNPVYRKLWFAILLSGTCVAAQDTAATWTMNMLGSSRFLLSLISTVASLPFFLFTVPAGALADIVNRRNLLCLMNLWLAGAAVLLTILGSFQLLNPYVLLFCVFLYNRCRLCVSRPCVVRDCSGGGYRRRVAFGRDARRDAIECFGNHRSGAGRRSAILSGCELGFWVERPLFHFGDSRPIAMERARSGIKVPDGKSFSTAVRYVRHSPAIQVVLARNILFAFFISVIPALIPVP
jgi:Transmembrane secretion effector